LGRLEQSGTTEYDHADHADYGANITVQEGEDVEYGSLGGKELETETAADTRIDTEDNVRSKASENGQDEVQSNFEVEEHDSEETRKRDSDDNAQDNPEDTLQSEADNHAGNSIKSSLETKANFNSKDTAPEGISVKVSDKQSPEASDKMPDYVPDQEPVNVPKIVQDKTSVNASPNIPENIPRKPPDKVSHQVAVETRETTSSKTPKFTGHGVRHKMRGKMRRKPPGEPPGKAVYEPAAGASSKASPGAQGERSLKPPGEAPDRGCGEAAGNLTVTRQEEVPVKIGDKTAVRAPDNISVTISDMVPHNVPENSPRKSPGKLKNDANELKQSPNPKKKTEMQDESLKRRVLGNASGKVQENSNEGVEGKAKRKEYLKIRKSDKITEQKHAIMTKSYAVAAGAEATYQPMKRISHCEASSTTWPALPTTPSTYKMSKGSQRSDLPEPKEAHPPAPTTKIATPESSAKNQKGKRDQQSHIVEPKTANMSIVDMGSSLSEKAAGNQSNEHNQRSDALEPTMSCPPSHTSSPSLPENPAGRESSEQGHKSPISEPKSARPQPLGFDSSDFPICFPERVENYRRMRLPHQMPNPLLTDNYDPYPPNDFPSPNQVDRVRHKRRRQDEHAFRCPRHYPPQRQDAYPSEGQRDYPCEDCLKQYLPSADNQLDDSVESAQQQPPPLVPYYSAWPASLYAPGGYYHSYPAYPQPESQLYPPPPFPDWGWGAGNQRSPVSLYSHLASLQLGSSVLDPNPEFIVLAGRAKRSRQGANAYTPSSPSQSVITEAGTPTTGSVDGGEAIRDGDQDSITNDGT